MVSSSWAFLSPLLRHGGFGSTWRGGGHQELSLRVADDLLGGDPVDDRQGPVVVPHEEQPPRRLGQHADSEGLEDLRRQQEPEKGVGA